MIVGFVACWQVLVLSNHCAFFFTGHGGSDGLHGYVPSLDHVVADTVSPVSVPYNLAQSAIHTKQFVISFVKMD